MGKCVFNSQWPLRAEYKQWVKPCTGDKNKAMCSVCMKSIDLSKMGEFALKSHMQSVKHKSSMCSVISVSGLGMYFGQKTLSSVTSEPVAAKSMHETELEIREPPATAPVNDSSAGCSCVSDHLAKTEVLRAEILWTLQTITNHNSYHSNEGISKLFEHMFPDSELAKKFSCGEKKTAYMCVFGLAEYFKDQLLKDVASSSYFVILFDESLNMKNQKNQMDVHVRFWNENTVVTRYLGSEFLGHATADDMVHHFKTSVLDSGLDIKKMVQISMDGPNVNWKFYELIKKQLADDYDCFLINVGSCGLHIVHNSFKAGVSASGWRIQSVLSSMHYLFKDSPARREDYVKISGSTVLPLKFCSHRWLENLPVCERALSIWSNVEKYVTAAINDRKITKPDNQSFKVLSEAVTDKLIRAKLYCFKNISEYLTPFLTSFQSDKPMLCFISKELADIIRTLMRKFLKPDVLTQASTTEKLVAIDIDDTSNYVHYKHIDVGFLADKEIKKSGVSEKADMEFRIECRKFIVAILKKVILKCPIKYSLVRNLTCLNPREMINNTQKCRGSFKRIISILLSVNCVRESDCDSIINEYGNFLDQIPVFGIDKFKNFSISNDRVDQFLLSYMSTDSDDRYSKLSGVVRMLLVLSHGQAQVERGFSVNKEVEVENLREESTIAQSYL